MLIELVDQYERDSLADLYDPAKSCCFRSHSLTVRIELETIDSDSLLSFNIAVQSTLDVLLDYASVIDISTG
jgi:hypothetical protein